MHTIKVQKQRSSLQTEGDAGISTGMIASLQHLSNEQRVEGAGEWEREVVGVAAVRRRGHRAAAGAGPPVAVAEAHHLQQMTTQHQTFAACG